MFMSLCRNVTAGFTYINSVTASTENLISYLVFRPYGTLSLAEKRDANLNVLETVLMLVLLLQNCLVILFNLKIHKFLTYSIVSVCL